MVNWFGILLGAALLSAIWVIVTMIRFQEFLRGRGRKVNPLLLHIMIFDYVRQYRRITVQEYGRPGILYYQFVAANTLTLAFAVAAVLTLHWA